MMLTPIIPLAAVYAVAVLLVLCAAVALWDTLRK
jgi:hypothetical protein